MKKRNLIKGLLATPVIMMVRNRPVMAATNCTSISGMMSATPSRELGDCAEAAVVKEPNFWLEHPGCWPLEFEINLECKHIDPMTGRTHKKWDPQLRLFDVLDNTKDDSRVIDVLEGDNELLKAIVCGVISYWHPQIDNQLSPEDYGKALQLAVTFEQQEQLLDLLLNHYDGAGNRDHYECIIPERVDC